MVVVADTAVPVSPCGPAGRCWRSSGIRGCLANREERMVFRLFGAAAEGFGGGFWIGVV